MVGFEQAMWDVEMRMEEKIAAVAVVALGIVQTQVREQGQKSEKVKLLARPNSPPASQRTCCIIYVRI